MFFCVVARRSPACFPSETRQPLNPWSNHRFFGYTFVILRPSGFCNGVLHKHFCRWLRPDIHVVFISASCFCAHSISVEYQHYQSFLSSLSPLSFSLSSLLLLLLLLLLCSLILHLSTWQVTRSGPPAGWLIGGLSYQNALQMYAREAANFSTNHQLPSLDFAMNHYGQPDVAMFDFTCMYASENAAMVRQRHGHQLLITLVGDSLLEVRQVEGIWGNMRPKVKKRFTERLN